MLSLLGVGFLKISLSTICFSLLISSEKILLLKKAFNIRDSIPGCKLLLQTIFYNILNRILDI